MKFIGKLGCEKCDSVGKGVFVGQDTLSIITGENDHWFKDQRSTDCLGVSCRLSLQRMAPAVVGGSANY